MGAIRVMAIVLVFLAALAPSAIADTTPGPFGHRCAPDAGGMRFCPTSSLSERVSSFDGAPLDADVTLPPTGAGPWPTIVMMHGYGGTKASFEDPAAGSASSHYGNDWFAGQGYAVVTFSVRGTGDSCGNAQSRAGYPACDKVEFELGDQRYDARDVQSLLGQLVDEGVAKPGALGVTGISLGSLQSLELAVLYDRIRLLDGSFAPWVSPHGVPLHISAAYPAWAIGSLVDLFAPNGRYLSFTPGTAVTDETPIGVFKLSFPAAAVATAQAVTWSIPPTPDSFDLLGSLAYGAQAQPDDPKIGAIVHDLRTYHQTIGLPPASAVAPILMESGWDDSVVNGAFQAARMVDYLHEVAPRARISLQLADVGHGIDNNKPADVRALDDQATSFFDHYLQGRGRLPAPVTAYTATCPPSAASAGPFTGLSIGALNPGAVRFTSAPTQTVSSGGDESVGPQIDPVAARQGTCPSIAATDAAGTAVYTHKVKRTFTMLGLPTLRMTVAESGGFSQLDARLWDVGPDGNEHFVTRGVYALQPGQKGSITWQLFGGGYTFPAGDTVRLELLASDTPYLRPSRDAGTVTVSDLLAELPAHEAPDGGSIVTPMFNPSTPSSCAVATGRLHGRMLGPVRLGMRRARVRARFPALRRRGAIDVFCLKTGVIRVAYRHRRVAAALTTSPAYALRGVRPGTHLRHLPRRSRAGYFIPGRHRRGVVKIRHGTVTAVGIAEKRATRRLLGRLR